MHDFEAVARGERQRARWRSPEGWVRVDRLSDQRLCLRGPHREVARLSSAARADWTCLHQRQMDGGPQGALVEMMLVRREPEFTAGLQPQRRGAARISLG
jgi:hypothetical protein